VSNGKPVKEIIPGLIRKLLIQRKDYLKQQRINRSKKNRDPNQPKLPGMKQGGEIMTKDRSPVHRKAAKMKDKDRLSQRDIQRAAASMKKAHGGKVKVLSMSKAKDYPGAAKAIKLNKLGLYKKPKPVKKAHGGFVKAAGGTKRVSGSGAATKGTNFEGIF